jgi:hypothetical protein
MTTPIIKPVGPGLNTGKDPIAVNRVAPPSPIAGPTRAQVAQQALSVPAGLMPIHFSYKDVPGSGSDLQLYRVVADGAGAEGARIPIPMVFRGSLVGMTLASDVALTGGSVKVQAFINGSGSASLTWSGGTSATTTFEPNKFGFMAGNELTVRISPSSLTPSGSANIEVIIYVTQASST